MPSEFRRKKLETLHEKNDDISITIVWNLKKSPSMSDMLSRFSENPLRHGIKQKKPHSSHVYQVFLISKDQAKVRCSFWSSSMNLLTAS